jgi:hypothetical protein
MSTIEDTLEEADEFEREVAALGRSEKFMQFLEDRRVDPERIPLAEVRKRLGL